MYEGLCSVDIGRGCKLRSFVGGGYFFGKMRCWKEMGRIVFEFNYWFDIICIKYWGGKGL